mmetsp:Transcript_34240/g.58610  ORF Transcript_34240/g.58610 Transcript_34240/m.58610 type:complete len:562 (+) Transcript_34240:259-1944(+)
MATAGGRAGALRPRSRPTRARQLAPPASAGSLPPGGALDDVVDAQDHLGGLGGGEHDLRLELVRLADAELGHVRQPARVHLQAPSVLALVVLGAQARDKGGGVVARVVRNVQRHRAQRLRVRLHGEHLLARDGLGGLLHRLRHEHLGGAPPRQHGRRLDGLRQDAQRVVQRAVRLVDDVLVGAADHDGRGLRVGAAREAHELVLADHHLLDELARAELDLVGRVKRGDDVAVEDEGEALGALEVGVLDGHDARVGHLLLGQVVDELPVDEHVAAVREDAVDLLEHLRLLRRLDLGHLGDRVHLDLGAVDLHLVRVHRRVRHEHLAVCHPLRAADANLLVEQEAVGVEVRVAQGAARPLDDLDLVEVGRATELHHRVDRDLREELLVLREHLGRERRLRDVHQVVAELVLVLRVVHRRRLQRLQRRVAREAVARHHRLRVHLLLDELLRLAQELARQHADRRGAVTDLVVLHLGDVDEHLGRGVVDEDRLQNGGTVVGDGDMATLARGLQNLVHPLRPQRGLHEIGDRERAHNGGHASLLALGLLGTLLHEVDRVERLAHHG